jgi:hypothetical protein
VSFKNGETDIDWSKPVPLEHWKLVKDLNELPLNTPFAIGIGFHGDALCPAQTLTEKNSCTYIRTMTKTYGVDDQFWEDVTTYYDNSALEDCLVTDTLPKDIAIQLFLDAVDTTIRVYDEESILTVNVRD